MITADFIRFTLASLQAHRLRTALFFEQRRWRHLDGNPLDDPGAAAYIRALMAKIAELSGGSIDEEPDSPF